MDDELYISESDWLKIYEEDLEFVRELAEMGKYPETGVKLIEESIRLRKLGKISEAEKLMERESEAVKKWKAAEDERRHAMNTSAINFDDSNFRELSEHDLALIRAMEECEKSHEGMTFEEFKEMEDFLFGETDCEDIDFSETKKSENSSLEEWQEKEKGRIVTLERAIIRKSQKK